MMNGDNYNVMSVIARYWLCHYPASQHSCRCKLSDWLSLSLISRLVIFLVQCTPVSLIITVSISSLCSALRSPWLLLCQRWQSCVVVRFVILSVSTITPYHGQEVTFRKKILIIGVYPELDVDLWSRSTSINITQIQLSTMYFDSTGGATALLSDTAAAVFETLQDCWHSLNCLTRV